MITFVKRSHKLFNLEKHLIANEIIDSYYNHYSAIQQYNPMKPTYYGIKDWALVSNSSRYIYNLSPCCGGVKDRPQNKLTTSIILDFIRKLGN